MRICGIDPGMEGALAFICGGYAEVVNMPTKISIVDRKKTVDAEGLLLEFIINDPEGIIVEEQGVQGELTSRVSAFQSGRNFQALVNAIEKYKAYKDSVIITTCRPQEWKKSLGLLAKKGDSAKTKKEITEKYVMAMYPHVQTRGKRGGLLDGACDAVAIASYGLKRYF